ncbi:MAG: sulfite exporter TauE/SafE family protein [Bacteroidota bacterium]
MTWIEGIILFGVGVFTGFLNTVAGGGSLLTLPVMIFMGLPGTVANASNRVAIFISGLVAVKGFQSKGVTVFPYAWWVTISACIGAAIGAYFATDIRNDLFNKILAVVMVIVLGTIIFKPKTKVGSEETFSRKKNALSVLVFFFLGIYGGFIQAGVGFLVIATLTGIHGFNMAKTNSIKVFVISCYTLLALIIFFIEDKIRWDFGLVLAAGNSLGSWIASRWSVDKDDKLIQGFLVVAVLGLAIKLWFFG